MFNPYSEFPFLWIRLSKGTQFRITFMEVLQHLGYHENIAHSPWCSVICLCNSVYLLIGHHSSIFNPLIWSVFTLCSFFKYIYIWHEQDLLLNISFLPTCVIVSFYLFLKFFYFWTLQYCIGFAIYQHEYATDIHVFPILNPPPSSLPVPSLWVVPVHQLQASSIVHQYWGLKELDMTERLSLHFAVLHYYLICFQILQLYFKHSLNFVLNL